MSRPFLTSFAWSLTWDMLPVHQAFPVHPSPPDFFLPSIFLHAASDFTMDDLAKSIVNSIRQVPYHLVLQQATMFLNTFIIHIVLCLPVLFWAFWTFWTFWPFSTKIATPLPLSPQKKITIQVRMVRTADFKELIQDVKSIGDKDSNLKSSVDTVFKRSFEPHGKTHYTATVTMATRIPRSDLCKRLREVTKSLNLPYEYSHEYSHEFHGITPLYDNRGGADVELAPQSSSTTPLTN